MHRADHAPPPRLRSINDTLAPALTPGDTVIMKPEKDRFLLRSPLALFSEQPSHCSHEGGDAATVAGIGVALAAHEDGIYPNDALYDLESSADYDPAPGIFRIHAPLTAIN